MSTRVLAGHAPDVLAGLEAESCHLVVTSPPYLWLRSYNTEPQVWPNPDGTPLCADGAHEWVIVSVQKQEDGSLVPISWKCERCSSWRGELGREESVELYIAHLVFVFDAVRRVLRRDGLVWCNLAGSYFNNPGGQNGGGYSDKSTLGGYTSENTKGRQLARISARAVEANRQAGRQDRIGAARNAGTDSWLKPLDWVDTPGLFAHAMQRAGWYWRADIALIKVNPLPESVSGWKWERCKVKVAPSRRATDPRKANGSAGVNNAHGAVAIVPGANGGVFDSQSEWADCPGCDKCLPHDGLVLRRGNGRPTRAWERFLVFARSPNYFYDTHAVRERMADSSLGRLRQDVAAQEGSWRANGGAKTNGAMKAVGNPVSGRNHRDWMFWPTAEAQMKEAHYASYPPGLVEFAVNASTSAAGVCPSCLAPHARIIEQTETIGWRPTCKCSPALPPIPATVLDPFVGSGTSLMVADRLGRNGVGIDLQPEYLSITQRRVVNDAPLFATVHVSSTETPQQGSLFGEMDT